MAVKQLEPKQMLTPDYDSYDVEQGVMTADMRYAMQQEMSKDDFGNDGVAWEKSSATTMPKLVTYQSEHGSERVGLNVRQEGEYGSLDIEMTTDMGRPVWLTANIAECEKLAYNEAYLSNVDKKFKVDFIKDNQLGQILPISKSGAKGYNKIVFDMNKLSEFDPIGVEDYMTQMEIEGRLPDRQIQIQQIDEPVVSKDDDSKNHRAYPSVAYDMGMVEFDGQRNVDLNRPLPSMGEELLVQTKSDMEVEDVGFGY